jgi:gamma-glutamylcyclotransferase (GGCT)/AIG2-like uncharacterized protein YtfP
MDSEIIAEVTGQALKGEPAYLKNYVRKRFKEEMYPGITSKPMSQVDGVLYRKVSQPVLDQLDTFENNYYRREIVTLHVGPGKRIPAYAYIVLPEFRAKLSKEDWTMEWFLEHGKQSFTNQYEGFHRK